MFEIIATVLFELTPYFRRLRLVLGIGAVVLMVVVTWFSGEWNWPLFGVIVFFWALIWWATSMAKTINNPPPR